MNQVAFCGAIEVQPKSFTCHAALAVQWCGLGKPFGVHSSSYSTS